MSARESSGATSAWRSRRLLVAAAAAVLLAAAGTTAALAAGHSGGHRDGAAATRLTASTCKGPAGAAYVALAGWDGFSAIDTANCYIVQTYNVGDTFVPGDPGDQNYSSTAEGVAMYGSTLYFADAGNDTVAVIDAATLDPKNYNPDETLIHVGFAPGYLAVRPDGKQVWAADTGPQTGPQSPSGISVISTATDKVTGGLRIPGGPAEIAFSPSGASAYVTTAEGLWVINTATLRVTAVIRGLGDPHGVAVSADGSAVYVTNTTGGEVDVISTATNQVTGRIPVGQLPWQLVLAPGGKTLYVADGDSNEVSVISTGSGTVTGTIQVAGDPDTLAVTPNGAELWVAGLTSGIVTIFDTSDDAVVGSFNLGDEGANSGDGYEPTDLILVKTPTPGGTSTSAAKVNAKAAASK
jgi:YVTN family beta-propeller protein